MAIAPARWKMLCVAALLATCLMGRAAQPASDALKALAIDTGSAKADVLVLAGQDATQQLVVTGTLLSGQVRDLSREVSYEATPGDVVRVDATGLVTALKEGRATITVKLQNQTARANVRVTPDVPVNFANQVVPIFTKLGCNGGTCHGKTGGQNGFALSLFGFEPSEDYEALVKEPRPRRILPSAPAHSLLLLKAAGTVAHAGGKRLPADSMYHRLLLRWIEQGMPFAQYKEPEVTRIEVVPGERVVIRGGQQQLAVLAHLSDGSRRDVTRLAQFEVNDSTMAEVSTNGLVTAKKRTGSAAVMARYQTHVDAFRALVPLGEAAGDLPPPKNFIDGLVFKRWKTLGLPPSPRADDATFLRRATIDIAGRLPTLDETKAFLASKDEDRHEKLVDRLLASPDYAYNFAGKWSAVLRNRRKSDKDNPAITINFHRWIKESIEKNKPFDQFVREILTATGKQTEHPMIVWYREASRIDERVEDVSQLFLGQRITCARCHHHPLEKWSQQDYYGMTAFFTRIEFRDPPPPKKAKGMKDNPPLLPMEVLHRAGLAEARNPRTGQMVRPTGLGSAELKLKPEDDPRAHLVDWMTSKNNPYFARALVNRYWKHFLGRGLVEPEDDMRVTNPPTNPELLDGLAKYFIDSKYDVKKLVRAICTSHVYRLSAEPNRHNADDSQSYSRFQPRRLTAEVMLDAIDDVTLTRTSFKGMPAGTRAVQLPDNQVDSYFLSAFGRPNFASACECERSGDANLAHSLHLVNSKDIMDKITKGRAARLAKDTRPHAERIRELYLLAFSREPLPDETRDLVRYVEARSGRLLAAYEDVLWSIVNTKEFLFNH